MRKNYMAHTVWRYEEELYGTHLCTFRTPCDQRTAAGPQQGQALDASRKLVLRTAFSAVSFCNAVAKTVEIE